MPKNKKKQGQKKMIPSQLKPKIKLVEIAKAQDRFNYGVIVNFVILLSLILFISICFMIGSFLANPVVLMGIIILFALISLYYLLSVVEKNKISSNLTNDSNQEEEYF